LNIQILTGDPKLNQLLAPGAKPERQGINYDLDSVEADIPEAPILLILGAAGTGKTALALQICDATAKANNDFHVFLYSMEQSKSSLKLAAKNFNYTSLLNDNLVDLETQANHSGKSGCVFLCHLSPLPLSAQDDRSTFEDRFRQLCHMISEFRNHRVGCAKHAVFIIDSLNALSSTPVERSDIYRLFSVFRSQGIPLVITAERQEFGTSSTTSISESARFLADVVLELKKDYSKGHLLQYLEISKSRIRMQALGSHLYKIRTTEEMDKGGVQVYRSVPCVISVVREEIIEHKDEKYVVYSEQKEEDLPLLFPASKVNSGHCFALLGPPGTHKYATALNLAAGIRKCTNNEADIRHMLILSFGGLAATNFDRIAWFEEKEEWRKIGPLIGIPQKKWWSAEGKISKLNATQLTFRIGHLTPEECIDQVEEITHKTKFSAVVLSDTAQISTGFPLLKAEPLFIPALIDLFRSRGLTSVCIGIHSENSQNLEMDFALQSCADGRLYFSHYPNVYDLAEDVLVWPSLQDPSANQQRISVIADVVAERDYTRQPHWIDVSPEKHLRCRNSKTIMAEANKSKSEPGK
jgi:KaiC/GvpD/RAD55 family RecA-like ATPase